MSADVRTLTELLAGYLTRRSSPQAIGSMSGEGMAWMSTAEIGRRIRALAAGLAAQGVTRGDRVALLAENRWEWMVGDFGILAAGAVTVPIHPGLTATHAGYILAHAGVRVALVSTLPQTRLLLEARREVPGVEALFAFDEDAAQEPGAAPLSRLLEQGEARVAGRPGWEAELRAASAPEDLASLIYTSGTTGDPKGVMLTHGNFASNVSASCRVFSFLPTDVALSILPLSHVFERTVDYCYYHSDCSVVHLSDFTRVGEALLRVRPTVFAAVPRLYEKLYSRIQEGVPPSRRALFEWSVRVGTAALYRRLEGRSPGGWLSIQSAIARRLVYRRILARLGGRLRFTISGGAPLAEPLSEFFHAIGLAVLEGYGLTETSPVISTNTMAAPRPGTVGPPLPGVEVRIAEDGEILTRGPHVMKGYWKEPEATARTIDAEGWLHTGDVGILDSRGYLRITDRKKEILVTAQGKNVAPAPVENALKALPLVCQAALLGDRRPYVAALLVPDGEVVARRSDDMGMAGVADADRSRHPSLIEAIREGVRGINARLDHHEQVRRFILLHREFSQQEGELTPTLKLKRRVIEKHFAGEIEALYSTREDPRVIHV